MNKKDEALKLALELKNSASAYWTEKEILIIEKLIKLLALAEQPAQQEPVARVAEVHMSRYTLEWTNGPLPEGTELYTSAQRTWVGLTDDEMIDLQDRCGISIHKSDFQVIEAKLKEKNT